MSLELGLGLSLTGHQQPVWYLSGEYIGYLVASDFRKGRYALPSLGPELLENGDFSDGDNQWADADQGTGVSTISGGQMHLAGPDYTNRANRQSDTIQVEVGKLYKLSAYFASIVGTALVLITTPAGTTIGDAPDYTWSASTEPRYWLATRDEITITVRSQGGSAVCNSVSLQELRTHDYGANEVPDGNWASLSDAVLSEQTDTGARIQTLDGDTHGFAGKSFSGFTIGQRYRVPGEVNIVNADSVRIRVGSSSITAPSDLVDVTRSISGNIDYVEFTAPAETLYFGFVASRVGGFADASFSMSIEAILPGPPLRAAAFEEIYEVGRAGAAATYTNAAGVVVAALPDAVRIDYSKGKRQVLRENESTRLHDEFPLNGSSSSATVTALPNEGLFTPYLIASTGAAWNRRETTVIPVVSGEVYAFRCRFREPEINSSGRLLVNLRNEVSGDSSNVRGAIGAESVATSSAGTIAFTAKDLPGEVREISGAIAVDFTGDLTLSAGPDTDTSGDGIICIAGQVTTSASADDTWIVGPGATLTRPKDQIKLTPLATALANLPALTMLGQGEGLQTPSGRILGGASNVRLLAANSSVNRLAAHNGTDALITSISPPADFNSPFGAVISFDDTGRSIAANGTDVATDANSIGDLSEIYLGQDGAGNGSNVSFDAFNIILGRTPGADIPAMAVPA